MVIIPKDTANGLQFAYTPDDILFQSFSEDIELYDKAEVDALIAGAIPSVPDASTTVKGIVEEATQAEMDAGTDTGGTGARLFAVPSKIISYITGLFAPLASPTFTGTVTTPAIIVSSETASRVAIIDGSKNVKSADTATYPSLIELTYVKGVTSDIQTQIDSKRTTYNKHKTGTATFEQWYCLFQNNTQGFTTNSKARNLLNYVAFEVEETMTLDRIGIEITAAGDGGSAVQVCVYASSNLLPTGNPITGSTGTLNGGSATIQSYTSSCLLTPGIYFFAYNHNSVANITFRTVNLTSQINLLGLPSTLVNWTTGYSVAETYGVGYVLPSPATTPTTRVTVSQALITSRLS